MSDDPRDPSLTDLLELVREQTLEGIRTNLPGVIVAYDKDKQRASVQVLIQDLHVPEVESNGGEDLVPTTVPVLTDVPVLHAGVPRGRITFPVKVGDYCLVSFCSSAIPGWLALGGGSPINPGDPRRHDLSDAVAILGQHNFAEIPTDAPDDAVVVHAGSGITIKLGSSGASHQVATKVDLDAIIGAFSDAGIAQALYNYGLAPAGPGKAAALAALVGAVVSYFTSSPANGSSKVLADT